ncbi:hypothetical protein [Aromatoleum toluclasticum]|uniref:hypothetical protein n=1 Tax=Aromatoleum toluclasticum TaxID=92003 RepID=UPI000370983A|nr:hypothetical protein [Aromatoleum toluclasticum]
MLNLKVVFVALSIWVAFTFVLGVAYGLAVPARIHMHAFLDQMLSGWLSGPVFLLGLGVSFAYGVHVRLPYVPIHNFLQQRWSA